MTTSTRACTRILLAHLTAVVLLGAGACSSEPATDNASSAAGVTGSSSPSAGPASTESQGAGPTSRPTLEDHPGETAGGTPGDGTTTDRTTAAPDGRDGPLPACAALSALAPHAAMINGGMLADAIDTANDAAEAILLLEGATLPADLDQARQDLIIFFAAVSTALAAVEVEEGDTTEEALEDADRGAIVAAVGPAERGFAALAHYRTAACPAGG